MARRSKPFTVGDYHCTGRVLGEGSYATVYEGFHKFTNERVAIKAMNMPMLRKVSPNVDIHLAREVNIMSSARDRHIVRLYAKVWNRARTYLYLVMEFCDEGDLADFIEPHRGKGIPEDVVKENMMQFAKGLLHLRTLNVVHRDLKPQNLMLKRDPESGNIILKIADFGFARVLKDHDLSRTHVGSPVYMAPEILDYRRYTVKTDLWSVGVIMYEMLYGRYPIMAQSVEELQGKVKKLATGEFRISYPQDKRISASCADLLKRLLQHDAKERISWNHFFLHPWLGVNQPSPLLPSFSSVAAYATHGAGAGAGSSAGAGAGANTGADEKSESPGVDNEVAPEKQGGASGAGDASSGDNSGKPLARTPERAAPATPQKAATEKGATTENGAAAGSGQSSGGAQIKTFRVEPIRQVPQEVEAVPLPKPTPAEQLVPEKEASKGEGEPAGRPEEDEESTSVAAAPLPTGAAGAASLDRAAFSAVQEHFSAAVAISQLAHMKARVGSEGDSLALHLKALEILQLVADTTREYKAVGEPALAHSLTELKGRVKEFFGSELASVRYLFNESNVTASRMVPRLLYEHALELAKHGAVDEMCGNHSDSAHWYSEALLLLRVLRNDAVMDSDVALLDTLLKQCQARHHAVSITMSSASRTSRQ